jgi:branched-chain amino acid transport system substrate-binding protein
LPDPGDDVDEVLIGYFGPCDADDPQGGDLWCAARLAVEEANRQGGLHGKPFRLVPGWSENPWGTGVRRVARMVYDEKVWAIIGGIDGPSTHLAEQVVAKARLALVSPSSTDKTVNLVNVPWMFSCAPGHHLQAPVLAEQIALRVGREPFVLLSATDHDSRLFLRELVGALAERDLAPRFHFQFKRGAEGLSQHADQVLEAGAAAVVVVAGADDSARMARALREAGAAGPIFGGPAIGRRRFLQGAGKAAEGVVFPLLYQPGPEPAEFHHTFQKRFLRAPDYAAAHTYDGVCLLIQAIRKAGLNRARIRDALAELSPWGGVTGTIRWDLTGSNARAVKLATIQSGRIVPLADRQSQATQPPAHTANSR